MEVEGTISLIEGILRSLASEDSSRRFITLALDGSETEEQLLGLLSRLTLSIQTNPVNSMEMTFSSDKGILQVVCVIMAFWTIKYRRCSSPTCRLDGSLALMYTPPFILVTWALFIRCNTWRGPGLPPHNDNQLLVNARAVGLTGQDYISVIGGIDRWTIGTECAGVVQKAGVNTAYWPGDRVCAIGQGLARTSVCVDADAVLQCRRK